MTCETFTIVTVAFVRIAATPPVTFVNPTTLIGVFIFLGILAVLKIVLEQWVSDKQREKRRTYYRDTYLNSDNWKRKRRWFRSAIVIVACIAARVPRRCTTNSTLAGTLAESQSSGLCRCANLVMNSGIDADKINPNVKLQPHDCESLAFLF